MLFLQFLLSGINPAGRSDVIIESGSELCLFNYLNQDTPSVQKDIRLVLTDMHPIRLSTNSISITTLLYSNSI